MSPTDPETSKNSKIGVLAKVSQKKITSDFVDRFRHFWVTFRQFFESLGQHPASHFWVTSLCLWIFGVSGSVEHFLREGWGAIACGYRCGGGGEGSCTGVRGILLFSPAVWAGSWVGRRRTHTGTHTHTHTHTGTYTPMMHLPCSDLPFKKMPESVELLPGHDAPYGAIGFKKQALSAIPPLQGLPLDCDRPLLWKEVGCSSDSLRYHREHSVIGVVRQVSRDMGREGLSQEAT